MPLTVHGDNTAPLVLLADQGKENPRTLRLKFLSKREIRNWQKRYSDATVIEGTESRDAAYDALLSEVVVGWDNIPGDFSIPAISDHYALPEFMAIMETIPMAMVPSPADLKK